MVVGEQRLAQPGVTVRIFIALNLYWTDLCAICRKLPNEPVQTPIGHRFCKGCLIVHGREQTSCSSCVEKDVAIEDDCIHMGAFYPDKGSKLYVDRLTAMCLRCNHVTPMKSMEDHLKTCI